MKTEEMHFWKGEWITDLQLQEKIETFSIQSTLRLEIEWVLAACDRLSQDLLANTEKRTKVANSLKGSYPSFSKEEVDNTVLEVSEFVKKKSLQRKINRELCLSKPQAMPFALERIDYQNSIFESWSPLGFLVHIAPSNAANVPFLTLIEGLLAGNGNFLKLPSLGRAYTLSLIAALVEADSTHQLSNFIMAVYLPISKNLLLRQMISHADGVVVWGNEETVQVIREMTPLHTQLIAWGPKISFAYFYEAHFDNQTAINKLAKDICEFDQQSCSSPQVVYLETSDPTQLQKFAKLLGQELDNVAPAFPGIQPEGKEQAEITQAELLQQARQALDPLTKPTYLRDDQNKWRIFIDERSGLQASPLYKTIWLKPLLRKNILHTLRPLRAYLQTVGLQCENANLYDITQQLLQSGVTRITEVGQMTAGYLGEPHDGVYALQRYSRRISVALSQVPKGLSYLEELAPNNEKNRLFKQSENVNLLNKKIMTSADVSALQNSLPPEDIQVYFKTGGSSGEPKLSIFTYDDYEMQMKFAAQGLFAAGLDPKEDRCINLFFAGGLYGGFLSFFSILEQLKAVQLTMAAETDLKTVGQWIVKQKVNVLLGMPSYLMRLFEENEAAFLKYGKIDKVFFGGEHFPDSQRKVLTEKFKVKWIRSATYGSNETGPMGYQCQFCEGSTHHLHDHLQHLEILDQKIDAPVKPGEAGRMILTSKVRQGQSITRYEIGDLGRWVESECLCGRTSPRFELLGRYGDVFKVGTIFLNYKQFERLLSEFPEFTGSFQLVITKDSELNLNFSNAEKIDEELISNYCLENYPDLDLVVKKERMLQFKVQKMDRNNLVYVKSSGKLKSVLGQRMGNDGI